MTSSVQNEDAAVGLSDVVPFLLENRLAERGAQISKAASFVAHIAISERLVAGQNPAFAAPIVEQVPTVLAQRRLWHRQRPARQSIASQLPGSDDMVRIARALLERLTNTLAFAA